MDTILKMSAFSEDSIHACIAACGCIDRIYQYSGDSSFPEQSLLKENAGLTQHSEPESRDALVATGAYEWLQDFHANNNNFSLSNTSVKSLHRKIFKYSARDEGSRGNYRTDIDEIMSSLFFETKNALKRQDRHPLFTISLFRSAFINLMPFVTGNALCANFLAYGLLYNNNYPVVGQIPLIAFLNNPDGAISNDSLVVLPESILLLLNNYYSGAFDTSSRSGSEPYLNPRRQSLLDCVSKNAPVKISDIMLFFPDESRNTIKKDLLFLRTLGLIVANGEGRGMVYGTNGN